MKAPSGNVFGKVPGAETRLEWSEKVAEHSRGFIAATLDISARAPAHGQGPRPDTPVPRPQALAPAGLAWEE